MFATPPPQLPSVHLHCGPYPCNSGIYSIPVNVVQNSLLHLEPPILSIAVNTSEILPDLEKILQSLGFCSYVKCPTPSSIACDDMGSGSNSPIQTPTSLFPPTSDLNKPRQRARKQKKPPCPPPSIVHPRKHSCNSTSTLFLPTKRRTTTTPKPMPLHFTVSTYCLSNR